MDEVKNKNEQVKEEKRPVSITIYPNDELRSRLERFSLDEGRSLSNSVTYILKEYFKQIDV